jgi:hypothetical protein
MHSVSSSRTGLDGLDGAGDVVRDGHILVHGLGQRPRPVPQLEVVRCERGGGRGGSDNAHQARQFCDWCIRCEWERLITRTVPHLLVIKVHASSAQVLCKVTAHRHDPSGTLQTDSGSVVHSIIPWKTMDSVWHVHKIHVWISVQLAEQGVAWHSELNARLAVGPVGARHLHISGGEGSSNTN